MVILDAAFPNFTDKEVNMFPGDATAESGKILGVIKGIEDLRIREDCIF